MCVNYKLHITNPRPSTEVTPMKENEKDENRNRKDNEKCEKLVVMACCPEGGDKTTNESLEENVLTKLREKLADRSNVVMTRLDDEDLKKIDALVEIEAFKSRSEAAAFFIKEGVNARNDIFQRVMPTVEKIRELKGEAKKSLSQADTH